MNMRHIESHGSYCNGGSTEPSFGRGLGLVIHAYSICGSLESSLRHQSRRRILLQAEAQQ